MRRGGKLLALSLATSLSLSFATFSALPTAFAEPSTAELTAARELFDQGLKLEEKSQWQPALEKFHKVASIKATPAVRFHMGLCLENLARLVDALNEFEKAAAEAQSATDAGSINVVKNAQKHVDELRDRIPRVTIQIADGNGDLAITIDGNAVSSAVIGTAIPLDPGSHTVRVTATGKVPFEKKIELVEKGAPTTVDVVLVASAPVDSVAPPTAPPEAPSLHDDAPARTKSGAGPWPWIIGGVGIAAFAGAGIMYAKRSSTISDLDATCGDDRSKCPSSKSGVADSGKTDTTVGNIFLGVGAAAIVTAVVLLIVAPSSSETKNTSVKPASIAFGGGPAPLGFGVQGAF